MEQELDNILNVNKTWLKAIYLLIIYDAKQIAEQETKNKKIYCLDEIVRLNVVRTFLSIREKAKDPAFTLPCPLKEFFLMEFRNMLQGGSIGDTRKQDQLERTKLIRKALKKMDESDKNTLFLFWYPGALKEMFRKKDLTEASIRNAKAIREEKSHCMLKLIKLLYPDFDNKQKSLLKFLKRDRMKSWFNDIEEYLSNHMSDEERMVFLSKMEKNKELEDAYNKYDSVDKDMRADCMYAEKQIGGQKADLLISILMDLNNDYIGERNHDPNDKQSEKQKNAPEEQKLLDGFVFKGEINKIREKYLGLIIYKFRRIENKGDETDAEAMLYEGLLCIKQGAVQKGFMVQESFGAILLRDCLWMWSHAKPKVAPAFIVPIQEDALCDSANNPADQYQKKDEDLKSRDCYFKAMEKLPPKRRTLIELIDRDGKSPEEISHYFGHKCIEVTRTAISKARQELMNKFNFIAITIGIPRMDKYRHYF